MIGKKNKILELIKNIVPLFNILDYKILIWEIMIFLINLILIISIPIKISFSE